MQSIWFEGTEGGWCRRGDATRMQAFIKSKLGVDIQAHKINDRTCIDQMENLEEKVRVIKVKIKLKHMHKTEVFIDR